MKKIILFLVVCLEVAAMVGCGGGGSADSGTSSSTNTSPSQTYLNSVSGTAASSVILANQ